MCGAKRERDKEKRNKRITSRVLMLIKKSDNTWISIVVIKIDIRETGVNGRV